MTDDPDDEGEEFRCGLPALAWLMVCAIGAVGLAAFGAMLWLVTRC